MSMQNKGFTLVEVLIGLSIATVAAVSVAYTIANTNKVADAGKKTFIATNLAHQGLELTRALRDDIWFTSGEWATDEICGGSQADYQDFHRTVSVDCEDDNEDTEFIEVSSEVIWQSPQGEEKKVLLKEKLYNWYVAPTP